MSAMVLVIRVEMTDEADFDWLRNKCVAAVENEVEENASRLDGQAEVVWDMEDVRA